MDKDLLANIRACENNRTGVERAAKRARRAHPVCTFRPAIRVLYRPIRCYVPAILRPLHFGLQARSARYACIVFAQ